MEHSRLGTSGLTVSVVGLGTSKIGPGLDDDGCRQVLVAALEERIA